MQRKNAKSGIVSADRDDAPEWTDDMLERAELAENGRVIRPATGTTTRPRGRPRLPHAKQQISLRLDPEVIEGLRATGDGWQGRVNDVLRKWLDRRGAVRKAKV